MLVESWIPLAARAWEGYQASGRGLLLLDYEDDTIRYVPAAMPEFAASREKEWRDAQRLVKEYDPKNDVVLMLNNFFPNTMTAVMQPTPEAFPTPPESYMEMHEDE
jgi:hypothetical protein